MPRTTNSQALLIGLLATLASFCALHAFGEQPYSIVAQSNSSTAATGRKPLGQRIAAANLPLVVPARQAASSIPSAGTPAGGDLPESATTAAESSSTSVVVAEESVPEESAVVEEPAPETPTAGAPLDAEDSRQAASEEPAVVTAELEAAPAEVMATPKATPPAQRSARTQPRPAREALLQRLRATLAGKTRSANTGGKASPPAVEPHPMPAVVVARSVAAPPAETSVAVDTTAELSADVPATAVAPEHVAMDPAAAAPTLAAAFPASAESRPAGEAPARIEFDVRESRSLVNEGEQIVVRIAVRNVGTEPAERVNATLFFAEGIEPVQAIGHTAEVYPGEVRFDAVPAIPPGDSVDLLVMAVGTRPGSVTYRGELNCERLAGRIAREGAVTVRPRRTGGQ